LIGRLPGTAYSPPAKWRSAVLNRILTVGGLTLASRITGFLRDIMLAAILGAGPVADAFFIALRLPNPFRAIFAEGAFNAAFVAAYARIRGERGAEPARLFATAPSRRAVIATACAKRGSHAPKRSPRSCRP
jgi:peptidoglycan biosynthesis protein MviN/MurJ (putative lipid II flippase)